MSQDRHEQERANWLLAHDAGWHMADRRMANKLKMRAVAKSRSKAGAAESAHHESQLRWIGSRFIARGENEKERFFRLVWLGVGLAVLILTIGPALALSWLCYVVGTHVALSRGGVPHRAPWFIAAVVAAVAGGIANAAIGFVSPFGVIAWPPQLVIYLPVALRMGLWIQVTLALVLTAWHLRRHGWPGVSSKKPTKGPSLGIPKGTAVETSTPAYTTTTTAADTAPVSSDTDEEPAAPTLSILPPTPPFEEDDEIDEIEPEYPTQNEHSTSR